MVTTTRTTRLALTVVSAVGIWIVGAGEAAALSFDANSWGGDGSTCLVSNIEVDPLPSSMRASLPSAEESDDSPCGDLSEDATTKEYNICFAEAGAPASVVPELTARARANDLAERIAQAAGGSDSSGFAVAPEELRPHRESPASQPVPDPSERQSCTAKPSSCESIPPLPPTLSVEAGGPSIHVRVLHLDVPDRDRVGSASPPAYPSIGPAREHRSPPYKPPRG